ncbi:MAG: 4Fe-4S binding protein [Candidatus Helarchaeota archaeon]|nr:4Fe-4S binding protein [Candidatus Helarchaeota archaeon]
MAEFEIKVDQELCSGCSSCVLACPINIEIEPHCADGIAPKTNDVVLRVINGVCRPLKIELCRDKTFKCGLCEEICANGALKIIEK